MATSSLPGGGGGSKRIEALKQNPTLMIDTKFFDFDFKLELIEEINISDDKINGILINSENFHALNLLSQKYKNKIKCCYIDPPFNGKSSEILYKNNFKHSSWLTMIENRLILGSTLLQKDGVLVVAIGEIEQERLGLLLAKLFPEHERICISVINNPAGQQSDNFSYVHEFAYFIYSKSKRRIGLQDREDNGEIAPLRDHAGDESFRESAKNCFYPILIKNGKIIKFGEVCDNSFHPTSVNVKRDNGVIEVYPIDPQGIERKWRYSRKTVEGIKADLTPKFINQRKIWDIHRTKTKFNYKTVWNDRKYSSNNHGAQLLNAILGAQLFSYPKSIYTVFESINASTQNSKNAIVLDFFAGSGTTGHAVLQLNKKDQGKRKFILIETELYFDSVTKARIQKVIYSDPLEKWETAGQ